MTSSDLFDTLEATWPPLSRKTVGDWVIREGAGGGKRVSAATLETDAGGTSDVARAEQEMRALGQTSLFSLKPEQTELDTILAGNGYEVVDPTILFHVPIRDLGEIEIPPLSAFPIWEPLQIMRDIWQAGGVGAARQAVMERVSGPKTGILGRINNKPAGAAFVALHGQVAMLHALEILEDERRQGLGRNLALAAAKWALGQGATDFALAVTRANRAATALYSSLGMRECGAYHYRIERS
ncbi:MAG: GNAT family N-acetyltransferase [Litoreibacter sp.]|nr:GNAT family N-acetyltransferase [Litoreibacter sp.]